MPEAGAIAPLLPPAGPKRFKDCDKTIVALTVQNETEFGGANEAPAEYDR